MKFRYELFRCIIITIFVVVIGYVIGFIDSDTMIPVLIGVMAGDILYIVLCWSKNKKSKHDSK